MKAYEIKYLYFLAIEQWIKKHSAVGKIGFPPFTSNGRLLEASILVRNVKNGHFYSPNRGIGI